MATPLFSDGIQTVRIPLPVPDVVTILVSNYNGPAIKFAFIGVPRNMLDDEELAASIIREALQRCDEKMSELGEHS
jgi:hypothetical protein